LTIASLNFIIGIGSNTVAFRALVGSAVLYLGDRSSGGSATLQNEIFEGELDVGAGTMTVALQWTVGNTLGGVRVSGTRTLVVEIA
jgi:hypothetical protein